MTVGFNFVAQHNYRVYIEGFRQSLFTEMTGGERRREVSKTHPGGSPFPVNTDGPVEVTDLTLRKPYDPVVDAPLEAAATADLSGAPIDWVVVRYPVRSDGVPIPNGKIDTFHGCSLMSFKKPDVQRGSAQAGMLEITLSPEYMI